MLTTVRTFYNLIWRCVTAGLIAISLCNKLPLETKGMAWSAADQLVKNAHIYNILVL